MGSHVQAKKRAFVKILLRIAALYRFVCKVNRVSRDDEINAAYRKVAHKCHPDKGGDVEHTKLCVESPRPPENKKCMHVWCAWLACGDRSCG